MNRPKTYAFDLDGTLCSEEKTFERALAKPLQANIDITNELYNKGHTIIIFTARGWAEYRMTENWLKVNKVSFHTLICGKPIADCFIDDKALNVDDIEKLKGQIK